MNPEKITSNSENSETELTSGSKWSILESLAGKYDAAERGRVDQLKDNLRQDLQDPSSESSRYRYEQISAPPSTLRKIGRLALDRLGIHFSRSETRRNREAMAVAIREYDTEQKQKELEDQRRLEEQEVENKRRKAAEEKAAFEKDFVYAMDNYRLRKKMEIRARRTQESVEREFNSELLTVDKLEEEVLAENPEVEKDSIEYNGTEVPVYILKGLPFSMLSHNIAYKKDGDEGTIGATTSRKLIEDPSIWVQSEEKASKERNRGNVISLSYINSNSNLTSRFARNDGTDICYGFSHLAPFQYIHASTTDARSPQHYGKGSTKAGVDIDILDELKKNSAGYNEVVVHRYSEDGQPYGPDYIIAQHGIITEDMLRHAKFFGVPIVDIWTGPYEEKMQKRTIAALESVNENSSYEEIMDFVNIFEMDECSKRDFTILWKNIGDGSLENHRRQTRRDYQGSEKEELSEKFLAFEKIEIEKRIDFIGEKLANAIMECKKATSEQRPYQQEKSSAQILRVEVCEHKLNRRRTLDGDKKATSYIDPAIADEVKIVFQLKKHSVETRIIDGERRTINEYNKQDVADSNSSYYDKIYPLAMQYIDAIRENKEALKD